MKKFETINKLERQSRRGLDTDNSWLNTLLNLIIAPLKPFIGTSNISARRTLKGKVELDEPVSDAPPPEPRGRVARPLPKSVRERERE